MSISYLRFSMPNGFMAGETVEPCKYVQRGCPDGRNQAGAFCPQSMAADCNLFGIYEKLGPGMDIREFYHMMEAAVSEMQGKRQPKSPPKGDYLKLI
jgi:hypothetical protein